MSPANPYFSAAMILWIGAGLLALGGVLGAPIGYVIVAVLLAGLAMGMMRGMRWAAYLAFLGAGIMAGVVFGWVWVPVPAAPQWWAVVTSSALALSALALFVALWRPKDPAAP